MNTCEPEQQYCCEQFSRYFRRWNCFQFITTDHGSSRYYLHAPEKDARIAIDYCPWCAKPVSCEEFND